MRSLACWSGLALSLVVAAVACGSDDGGGGGSSGAGGSGGTSGTGGSGATGGSAGAGGSGATGGAAGTGGATDGGATVTFTGTVTEFQATGGVGKGLADVQICVKDLTTPPCVKTDATGAYTLAGIPANFEGVLLLTKTGYVNVAVVGTTQTTDEKVHAVMPTTAVGQVFATAAGFTWPLAGKSIIGFAMWEKVASDAGADAGMVNIGVAGATLGITPASGKGPVYLGATGLPDTAATSTSAQGAGFFGDLPPGDYTMKATSPSGKTCTRGPKSGWAAASADSAKLPAIADYVVSAVFFDCK